MQFFISTVMSPCVSTLRKGYQTAIQDVVDGGPRVVAQGSLCISQLVVEMATVPPGDLLGYDSRPYSVTPVQ